VNLKVYDVNNKDRFHIDSLDLYQSRSREAFIRQVHCTLNVSSQNQILEEINTLITTLEELRIVESNGEKNKKYEMTEEERKEALAYLQAPHLLERIAADFKACGMVGNPSGSALLPFLRAPKDLKARWPYQCSFCDMAQRRKPYRSQHNQQSLLAVTPEIRP